MQEITLNFIDAVKGIGLGNKSSTQIFQCKGKARVPLVEAINANQGLLPPDVFPVVVQDRLSIVVEES
jgi:hypothetical protein